MQKLCWQKQPLSGYGKKTSKVACSVCPARGRADASSMYMQMVFLWYVHSQSQHLFAMFQAGEDPFGDQRKDKKSRIASQEGRQLKNKQASDKIHGKPALPPTLKLAASLPEHGKGAPTKRRELKSDVRQPDATSNMLHASSSHLSRWKAMCCWVHICSKQMRSIPQTLAMCGANLCTS